MGKVKVARCSPRSALHLRAPAGEAQARCFLSILKQVCGARQILQVVLSILFSCCWVVPADVVVVKLFRLPIHCYDKHMALIRELKDYLSHFFK